MSDYTITFTQTISANRFEFWSGAKARMDDATDDMRRPKKAPKPKARPER